MIKMILEELQNAEQMEYTARVMEQQERFECTEKQCADTSEQTDKRLSDLLDSSYSGYLSCLQKMRSIVERDPSECNMKLLARVLMDIDVHKKNAERDPSELFWEPQYWFLRMYYTYGNAEYLLRAREIESFRHAEVKVISD